MSSWSNSTVIETAMRECISAGAPREAVTNLVRQIAEQVWAASEWQTDRAGVAATAIDDALKSLAEKP